MVSQAVLCSRDFNLGWSISAMNKPWVLMWMLSDQDLIRPEIIEHFQRVPGGLIAEISEGFSAWHRACVKAQNRSSDGRDRPRSVSWRTLCEHALFKALSPAELKVLYWMVQGYKTKAIAAKLYRHERTIRIHWTHILKKCGVSRDTQLLLLLTQAGYLPLASSGDNTQ